MDGIGHATDNSTDAAMMQYVRLSHICTNVGAKTLVENSHWIQWKRTLQVIKKNSIANDGTMNRPYGLTIQEKIDCDKMCISDVVMDDGDGMEEAPSKKRRRKHMSQAQKNLLHNLIDSKEKLQNGKIDGLTSSCPTTPKEWEKIALKLNSVTGPQKTWWQWKKCWNDVQKYSVRADGVEKMFNSSVSIDSDNVKVETSNCIPGRVKTEEETTAEFVDGHVDGIFGI